MITESNKEKDKGLVGPLAIQIELSQELARIALDCPTCRELFKNTIVRFRRDKNKKSSDFSSQEESQTEFVNPNNNNAAENGISNGEVISNEINTLKYK
jgi:hypothetical protein